MTLQILTCVRILDKNVGVRIYTYVGFLSATVVVFFNLQISGTYTGVFMQVSSVSPTNLLAER